MPEYNESNMYCDPICRTVSVVDNGALTYINYTFEQVMTLYSTELITREEARRWLHIPSPKKGENIEVNNDSR